MMMLFEKVKEAAISVIPITLIVLCLFFTPLLSLTPKELLVFMISAAFLIVGIALFNLGADLSMTPMGEYVGTGLTKTRRVGILTTVGFAMGVLITIAEPDLSVLAEQVSAVMNGTVLIFTVAAGVGLFLMIAILKIVCKKSLSTLLMFFYLMLFAVSALLIEKGGTSFVPLSFDSGGVTTGPITVPFIMAFGVGVASTIGGRDANENSFGLIALCSIGPILAVMCLALSASGDLVYELADYSIESHLGGNFLPLAAETAFDVLKALALVLVFFMVLQFRLLNLSKRKMYQILVGIVYTFIGLVVFLMAVSVGFMPIGFKIGEQIAMSNKWIAVILAFVIGMVVVLAEPAVHVLKKQVEDVTGGTVTGKSMLLALSAGVGISLGLSMIRMIFGFSILYYIIPGYLLSLGLSFFVPKIYTAIAFDSGGVASGPLTSSFILPLMIGACETIHGTSGVLTYAFGVIAMVAMTPLITIQILGFRAVFVAHMSHKIAMKRILDADDEQIIYFAPKGGHHGR